MLTATLNFELLKGINDTRPKYVAHTTKLGPVRMGSDVHSYMMKRVPPTPTLYSSMERSLIWKREKFITRKLSLALTTLPRVLNFLLTLLVHQPFFHPIKPFLHWMVYLNLLIYSSPTTLDLLLLL